MPSSSIIEILNRHGFLKKLCDKFGRRYRVNAEVQGFTAMLVSVALTLAFRRYSSVLVLCTWHDPFIHAILLSAVLLRLCEMSGNLSKCSLSI